MTTGTVIVQSRAVNPSKGIGLAHVETFTSLEGIPLYATHKYELESVYNNTTAANADSMASVFLGLDDPEFVKPVPREFARRSAALFESDSVTVHTTAGDFTALLNRDAAPNTSIQVARLALGGVFNRAQTVSSKSEVRLTIPSTEARTMVSAALVCSGSVRPNERTCAPTP